MSADEKAATKTDARPATAGAAEDSKDLEDGGDEVDFSDEQKKLWLARIKQAPARHFVTIASKFSDSDNADGAAAALSSVAEYSFQP